MTNKEVFTEEEWDLLRSVPPSAGMVVSFASHGGLVRETFEMGKVYAEARKQHGESELLDAIVASKPERDHTKSHSLDELKQHTYERLREAIALLGSKATPDEVDDYRNFILTLAERVAGRHEEDGAQISPAEQQAIEEIRGALGGSPA